MRLSKPWKVAICGFAVLFLLVFLAPVAEARLGGGEGWGGSGPSSDGGGLGGEGVGFVVIFLIRLCITHPVIGVPLTVVVIIVSVVAAKDTRKRQQIERARFRSTRRFLQRRSLFGRLHSLDPNFSRFVFLDFVHLLYARAQQATSESARAAVQPYMADRVFDDFPFPDHDGKVLIGGIRLTGVSVIGNWVQSVVEIEANLFKPEGSPGGGQRYRRERWTFQRKKGVLTRSPEDVQKMGCPSCGAPSEREADGSCTYCGQPPQPGREDWALVGFRVLVDRQPRREELTAGGGDEVGLDRPTLSDPQLPAQLRALKARDPKFSLSAFRHHVREVFLELQKAWAERDWSRARPWESDRLFDSHRYFIERFLQENMANRLDDVQITVVEPVRIFVDAYFESITVRIFAKMKDYTVDLANGKVISGSRTKHRRFSEYWTFSRRSGTTQKRKLSTSSCPSCGATLKINQAGICEYCDSLVTSGNFSWVLALIEQDEVYSG